MATTLRLIALVTLVVLSSCTTRVVSNTRKVSELPVIHTHYNNYIQRVVVISGDTTYNGIKEFTFRGHLFFYSGNIDSIIAEQVYRILHFEPRRMFRRTQWQTHTEVRRTTTVFSNQTDTIFNLFATENNDVSSDVFWAQVKTSYLVNILEQNELIVKSDSLWIIVVPEYFHRMGSNYYIYQYCKKTQMLHLSVISFTQELTPEITITFSDSAQPTAREQRTINENLTALLNRHIYNRTSCLESDIFVSFIYRLYDKNTGVFHSHGCDNRRSFYFALPFAFTGMSHFGIRPRMHFNSRLAN